MGRTDADEGRTPMESGFEGHSYSKEEGCNGCGISKAGRMRVLRSRSRIRTVGPHGRRAFRL